MRPRRFSCWPGPPGWLLWSVVVLAGLAVLVVLLSHTAGLRGGAVGDGMHWSLPAAQLGTAAALLIRRVRVMPVKLVLWRRMAGAALLLSVLAVAAVVLAFVPETGAVAHLPPVWAPVIADVSAVGRHTS